MKYTHPCVKCGVKYKDDDPEAYYCAKCNIARKKIAAEIDKKLKPSKEVVSDLDTFISQGKTMNSARGGLATFVRVKI
jgi:hypothetical protein